MLQVVSTCDFIIIKNCLHVQCALVVSFAHHLPVHSLRITELSWDAASVGDPYPGFSSRQPP
jgi:hypothetical protein